MKIKNYKPLVLLIFCSFILSYISIFPTRSYASNIDEIIKESSTVDVVSVWDNIKKEDIYPYMPYADPHAPKGGEFRISTVGTFDNFNPFSTRGYCAAYMNLVFENLGISVRDNNFKIHGLIAKNFVLPEDRSFLLVNLREEARFADGHAVTAEDVVFSYNALINEANPIYKEIYKNIESVTAKNDHSVLFKFKEKNNRELPLIIAQFPVLPSHWWKKRNIAEPNFEIMPGSGPYTISDYKMGEYIVFSRNLDYWGSSLDINQGLYNFDTIKLEYFRDSAVAREAFFGGMIDYYNEGTIKGWVNGYNVPAVQEGKIVKKEQEYRRNLGMSGLFFNTRKAILANKDVREALILLFDFNWINKALYYNAYKQYDSYFTGSPFAAKKYPTEEEIKILSQWKDTLSPEIFESLPEQEIVDYKEDLRHFRKALELFAKAGWTMNEGKLVNKHGQQMRLSILLMSSSLQKIYLYYSKNLERVGIKIDIQIVDQAQYIQRSRNFDYDFIHSMIPQGRNPSDEQKRYWTSEAANTVGSRNFSGISDPVIDELVEQLVNTNTYESRSAYISALDRLLQHGAYVINGWYTPTQRIAWWKDKVSPPRAYKENSVELMSWHKAVKE